MRTEIRILLPALLLTATAHAADPDPLQIMKRVDSQHRLAIEDTTMNMVLQKLGGEKVTRTLRQILAQDDKVGDRLKLVFTGPANIAGTAMLSIEVPGPAEDEQWLYLPAFRKTRRLGTGELGDRFMESDLFNEDLKRRHVEEFSYKLLRSEAVDGADCWVIETTPSDPLTIKESPYGKSVDWVRKDNYFLVKSRIFDKQQQPLKEVEFGQLVKVKGDAWRPNTMTIVDVQRKHRTIITVESRTSDVMLTPTTFTKQSLEGG